MTALPHSFTSLLAHADARATAGRIRRLWRENPMLVAFVIAAAALVAMNCLLALADFAVRSFAKVSIAIFALIPIPPLTPAGLTAGEATESFPEG